jgi:Immunity protein 27
MVAELIRADEVEIVGDFVRVNGLLEHDANTKRIYWLIENHLTFVAFDGSGWETLYRDPSDGRFWERTYPHSELQGGGPPALLVTSEQAAAQKYNL